MPKAGLEPARLAAPPPQDGVSANSTTSARFVSFHARGRFPSVGSAVHFFSLLLLLFLLFLFRDGRRSTLCGRRSRGRLCRWRRRSGRCRVRLVCSRAFT